MKAKGILIEQHKNYTIVLTKTGSFEKAKRIEHGVVGEEVFYETYKRSTIRSVRMKRNVIAFAVACMLLIFAIPTYLISSSHKVYAYVHIDINPSIELEVDRRWKVHSIHSMNEDGSVIIDQMSNYKGKKIDHVIHLLMDKSEQIGLLANGKNMLVGISYVNEVKTNDFLIDKLITADHDWEVAMIRIPHNIRKLAKQENKSMNELVANELEKADSDHKNLQVNENDQEVIESFYPKKHVKKQEVKEQEDESEQKQAEKKQDDSGHIQPANKSGEGKSHIKEKGNNRQDQNISSKQQRHKHKSNKTQNMKHKDKKTKRTKHRFKKGHKKHTENDHMQNKKRPNKNHHNSKVKNKHKRGNDYKNKRSGPKHKHKNKHHKHRKYK